MVKPVCNTDWGKYTVLHIHILACTHVTAWTYINNYAKNDIKFHKHQMTILHQNNVNTHTFDIKLALQCYVSPMHALIIFQGQIITVKLSN